MKAIDLHVHSTKSDGSYTPIELVNYALDKGLSAFALTDHDTTDGITEALAAARGKNIEVIPGIEFSSEYEGRDIHIVGLYIDYESDYFKRRLVHFVNGRKIRNVEMCTRLTEHGMPVTYEELEAEFPDCVLTRAHYAKYLLKHGYVKSVREAFDRYIGDHGPCFVPRKKITPMRAVEIILKAGGFPILAHPCLYHMGKEQLDKLVASLKDIGLMGIEAIYSTHTPADERQIRALAKKYDLCISGGSDFHGTAKPGLDLGTGYGKLFVPEEVLTTIKEKRNYMMNHPELYQKTKILFTDMDGTLLNHEKQVTDYTREVLMKWTDAGHKLVLCSGRDINNLKYTKEMLNLNYKGMYLIGYNGGEIYDCETGQVLYRIGLKLSQVKYVADLAASFKIHFHTYSETHIVSPAMDEGLAYYQRFINTPTIINPDIFSVLHVEPCKCLIIERNDTDKLEALRQELLPWAEKEGISLAYSNPYYLEVFPAASGKGAAVRKLCELLSINPAFSLAAGDAENDISMITEAGMGIAMANATEAVKKAATTITQYDNDHDGLAHTIEDMI